MAAGLEPEFLTQEELAVMTGRKSLSAQRRWLDANGWVYVTAASGRAIVGRHYARMRLGGVSAPSSTLETPNFAAIR